MARILGESTTINLTTFDLIKLVSNAVVERIFPDHSGFRRYRLDMTDSDSVLIIGIETDDEHAMMVAELANDARVMSGRLTEAHERLQKVAKATGFDTHDVVTWDEAVTETIDRIEKLKSQPAIDEGVERVTKELKDSLERSRMAMNITLGDMARIEEDNRVMQADLDDANEVITSIATSLGVPFNGLLDDFSSVGKGILAAIDRMKDDYGVRKHEGDNMIASLEVARNAVDGVIDRVKSSTR